MVANSAGGWMHDYTAVSTTVQEVADRLHQDIYGPDAHHSGFHSCSCFVQARWFLGVAEKPKLFWPDGKGGNAHEPNPDPRIEFLRLRDEVIAAAKVLDKKFQWHGDFVGIESARAYDDFKQKMQALYKHERECEH